MSMRKTLLPAPRAQKVHSGASTAPPGQPFMVVVTHQLPSVSTRVQMRACIHVAGKTAQVHGSMAWQPVGLAKCRWGRELQKVWRQSGDCMTAALTLGLIDGPPHAVAHRVPSAAELHQVLQSAVPALLCSRSSCKALQATCWWVNLLALHVRAPNSKTHCLLGTSTKAKAESI